MDRRTIMQAYAELLRGTVEAIDRCCQDDGSIIVPAGHQLECSTITSREDGGVEATGWVKCESGRQIKTGMLFRIIPSQALVPFTYADRDKLRGKWVVSNNGMIEICLSQFAESCAGSVSWKSLLDNYVFLDTKQPVGKPATE